MVADQVSEPARSVSSHTWPLILLRVTCTFAACTVRSQLRVFASMTVFAAVMVHGPV
jgi:hypothetical protein